MDQIERITYMEKLLDDGLAALQNPDTARERLAGMEAQLDELFSYYFSPLWMLDFADDEAELLPKELKRGVLSEDAVYNLFLAFRQLSAEPDSFGE